MKYLVILISASIVFASCASIDESNSNMTYTSSPSSEQGYGTLRGVVTDAESEEPIIFATVVVEGTEMGAMTDLEGEFRIDKLPSGMYNVRVTAVGYQEVRLENVPVKSGQVVDLDSSIKMKNEDSQIIELKPMIYLYTEEKMIVSVELDYDGEILHTYPKTTNSWEVEAEPDGTLTDQSGRKYYGLFWEGEPESPIQPNCGNVVAKDSLIPFLEASLEQLGLNFKEANEFIVFWLPILEQNDFNLIYFAESDYTDHARLKISPEPDNIIRVMMGYVPLDNPIDFPLQVLPEQPQREGFTVVEWGGTKCRIPNL